MADWDWYRVVSTAVLTFAAIQYGRWSQRRDNRKTQERRRG